MSTVSTKNFGEVKIAILNLLSDHEEHSADEIFAYVNNAIAPREITKSHMYTSISQLIDHGIEITKADNGGYCLKEEESRIIKDSKDFVVKRLAECMDYLQQRLSFDLSTLEYLSLKELNEELQNSISEIIDK